MKKNYIALTLAVITASSLLMTACGNNKNDTVSAMNNVSTETESIAESSTEIESSIETESTTEIETQDETESSTETQDATESTTDTSATTYTTTPTTGVMYATIDAYTYEGPDIEEYEIKATVQGGEQVSVIGKVNEANWYKIEQEGGIVSYISGDFLTTTDPNPAPSTPQTAQNTQPQQTPTTQPQQTQTPQQTVTPEQPQQQAPQQQAPQQTTPPADTGQHISPSQVINPATGDYYKPGDILPGGSIYAGDFNTDEWW